MKEPIYTGILQSHLDFAGYKPLNADLSDYDLGGGGAGGGAMHPVFTRLPAGVLLKGGNITFRPSDNASPYNLFGGMWGGGGATYDQSWIKNQIDVLAATGGNTVRFFGDVELQIAGSLPAASYLARVDAVIDYAATLGLYVVFTGASVYNLAGVASSGVITSAARQLFKDIYNTVRAHTNVISFDPIQESAAWVIGTPGSPNGYLHQPVITAGQLTTIIQTIYADLKAESTDLPITFSGLQDLTTFNYSMWLPYTPRTNVNACLDYLDFHCYYSPAFTDIIPALTEASGRPIIIGEFGSPTSSGGGLGAGCSYAQMLLVANQLQIDGYIAWALADQSTDPNDCWGMADNDGTLRSGRGTVFVNFPTTTRTIPQPLYIGTDFRVVALNGGAKIQARNASANTWADVGQWTNP